MGINPGLRSGAVGHHFAGNGNPFWRLLHAARLTPVLIDYSEDQRLAEFGIALTNLCPRTTRTAAELTRAEIARGHVGAGAQDRRLAAGGGGVRRRQPVSDVLRATRRARGRDRSGRRSPGARVFVVPNPSGLNASFPGFDSKLHWFKRLRLFVERVARRPTGLRRQAKAVD